MDGSPIPNARRHRVRITFGDQSYAEIRSPGRQNARHFVEVFGRIRADVRLRLLGALRTDTPETTVALATTLAVSDEALARHVDDLTGEGLVGCSPDGIRLTAAGEAVLAIEVGYVAAMSRIVVPPGD